MDFQTRHPQPFSAVEASHLDVSTIVAEIARLQNSLAHLDVSQTELAAFLAEEEDVDLRAAWSENEGVIASQRERIALLRAVLTEKVGADSLAHYGVPSDTTAAAPAPSAATTATPTTTAQTHGPTPAPAPAPAPLNGSTANGTSTGGGQPQAISGEQMAVDEDDGLHL
ncbi:uncharacterized protein EHS24_007869 [Apiotrichum porosum]|uniref:Uncharacterized protein n=1 Tax=Apiotrichum porosum TaxID=105984 RepID=A0A427XS60_9TREE|nr:uncharacterized protein EHS24_007869 [Apiotrichum porosum]RSH81686.1 hypothetical protein EHS24_007869 [Apiotrichum porosum]